MDTRGVIRTFEEYDAAVEWSRSAEADAVKISLPGKNTINSIHLSLDQLGLLRVH
jgi:hypothetical protein